MWGTLSPSPRHPPGIATWCRWTSTKASCRPLSPLGLSISTTNHDGEEMATRCIAYEYGIQHNLHPKNIINIHQYLSSWWITLNNYNHSQSRINSQCCYQLRRPSHYETWEHHPGTEALTDEVGFRRDFFCVDKSPKDFFSEHQLPPKNSQLHTIMKFSSRNFQLWSYLNRWLSHPSEKSWTSSMAFG